MRSDQLLRGMHKVISHDLPNQMVALQSLLKLLNEEETARLSDDGREFIRRLLNTTRRASDMVRFLKEMDRLKTFTCIPETIALATFASELQGELQRLHPDRQFEFDWHWDVPTIVGDPRVYIHAGLRIVRLPSPNGTQCRLSANSARQGPTTEIRCDLNREGEAPAEPVHMARQEPRPPKGGTASN